MTDLAGNDNDTGGAPVADIGSIDTRGPDLTVLAGVDVVQPDGAPDTGIANLATQVVKFYVRSSEALDGGIQVGGVEVDLTGLNRDYGATLTFDPMIGGESTPLTVQYDLPDGFAGTKILVSEAEILELFAAAASQASLDVMAVMSALDTGGDVRIGAQLSDETTDVSATIHADSTVTGDLAAKLELIDGDIFANNGVVASVRPLDPAVAEDLEILEAQGQYQSDGTAVAGNEGAVYFEVEVIPSEGVADDDITIHVDSEHSITDLSGNPLANFDGSTANAPIDTVAPAVTATIEAVGDDNLSSVEVGDVVMVDVTVGGEVSPDSTLGLRDSDGNLLGSTTVGAAGDLQHRRCRLCAQRAGEQINYGPGDDRGRGGQPVDGQLCSEDLPRRHDGTHRDHHDSGRR